MTSIMQPIKAKIQDHLEALSVQSQTPKVRYGANPQERTTLAINFQLQEGTEDLFITPHIDVAYNLIIMVYGKDADVINETIEAIRTLWMPTNASGEYDELVALGVKWLFPESSRVSDDPDSNNLLVGEITFNCEVRFTWTP